MYENSQNTILKERIIRIIEQSSNSNDEILIILYNELTEIKLSDSSIVYFCSCGYPLSYQNGNKTSWLEPIIKQEVDFRSYKRYYSCPKCDRLLEEFQD